MDFRDEIVESQKVRSDLFKWKIILVGSLGAAGLGFSSPPPQPGDAVGHPEYLLCLIPLVSLYVDILCSHLNLRIQVIGHYLRYAYLRHERSHAGGQASTSEAEYEDFVARTREMPPPAPSVAGDRPERIDAFAFEDWALHYSSLIISGLVFMWGFFEPAAAPGLFSAGLAGVVISALASRQYTRRCAALDQVVDGALGAPARHT